MSQKSIKYAKFSKLVLEKKIHLNSAENSAVTMYFGVPNKEDLISLKSAELYDQGKAIVNKVLETVK